jgi:hypothetical protein
VLGVCHQHGSSFKKCDRVEGSDPVYSPDRAALLEFSTSEHEASSISSQDTAMSQLSFASVSTIDPHQTQLPLIIEPQFSANYPFAPALNPFDNSLPVTLKSKWLAAWNGWPLGA